MKQPRSSGSGFRPRPVGLVLALALLAGVTGPLAQAAPAPGTIERVSIASGGAERNQLPTGSTTSCAPGTATSGNCSHRSISENGLRVVFTSRANNLADGDNNNAADVFLAELSAPAPGVAPALTSLKRVSVMTGGGAEGNADSESATISPNGEWVAFESKATNLGTDGDPYPDIFVYRVSDGALFLATPQKVPQGGPNNSFFPSIADNGTVAYTSYSTWLVPGGNAGVQQVFVTKDPAGTREISMVSVATAPNPPGPGSGAPSKEASISADGTKVAFNSGAKNIGSPEATPSDDVFVRNLTSNTTARLSTGAKSITPVISPDGTKVTFAAEGPIGADNDLRKDVYVTSSDGSGTIQMVSACTCQGNQNLDRPAVAPQINNSGAVVFQSAARYAEVRSEQVWLAGTPTLVSKSAGDGQAADAVAELPSINGDGTMVAFTSAATNLVSDDLNGSADVFVAQMGDVNGVRAPIAVVRVSRTPTREASGFAAEPTSPAAISGDGNIIAFDSDSSNLVPGDTNGVNDIFVRDRRAGTTTRISVGAGGAQTDGNSFRPAISADGNLVTFESAASNLVAGDTNGVLDVFVFNRATNEMKRVSNPAFGGQSSAASRNPSISPDGRWIAFESAFDLTAVSSTRVQVYRYDMANGAVVLVSKPNNGKNQAPDRDSTEPSVANDGSVAFLSLATKLISSTTPDPKPNFQDVFVVRPSGEIIRATTNNADQLANGDSFDPALSADGSKVVFSSLSDNMPAPGADSNPDPDVFVRDLAANRTSMISMGMGGSPAGGPSSAPAVNADGSLVAFVSRAGNLVPGDANGVEDVFLANLRNGGIERISVRPAVDNGEANNRSYTPSLNADGLIVAFKSSATNLVDNDGNGAFDTFVRVLNGVPTGTGNILDPTIKGLGYRFVAADGGIFSFDQQFYGSAGSTRLNRPIVGMAATPSNAGYWLVASDGGIFSYGDAGFLGSTGDIRLNSPIVGMTATPSGKGYWFVAADGGIFSFGDALFYGSMGGKPLNRPIVAMASTRTGKGYWLVASDGGIFSFGDAEFFGSTGDIKLNKPIVGMDRSNGGKGYRFVASDGGIFSFGDAKFVGSAGDIKLNKPIVGMARTRTGEGYWLVASDGGIFSFGEAKFYGSTGDIKLNSPIVGMAS